MRLMSLLCCGLLWAAAARAEVPGVAVDIAPVHSLVARVMRGVGAPDLILRPGASPHGYALRPSEAAALARADLVIWMGPALTPWLAGALETLAGDAARIELLALDKTKLLPFRNQATFAGAGGDDHGDYEGTDPHAWLDPVNGQVWLRLIAQELAVLDPQNAEIYADNAAKGVAELDALMADIDQKLAPLQGQQFLVFHDAYQYFEGRFGLPAAGAISRGDAARPGPARIAELATLVAAQGIACVLTEPQFDPRLADTIFPGGVTVGMLDPMGADAAPGMGLYPALLRALAAGFTACAP